MVDENSLSDYLAEGKTTPSGSHEGRDDLPPLKVMDETKYLEEEPGTLLLEIYDRGMATVEELSESTGNPLPSIKRHLGELRKQGYIGVNYERGTKHYFVSSDWGTQEFPSGPIIPLVYQYNLLSDTQRMEALKEAIDATVDPGDAVADLGAGVGVLSYLASETADKVYAVEMDREVYETGKEIMQNEGVDNVEYIRGDAREIDLPEDVDVILCELLDTALVAELQVPVMNYAVDHLLADDGMVVPARSQTSMQLVESDYEFYGGSFKIPHFEEYGSRESESRSEPVIYHDIHFDEPNAELIEKHVTIQSSKDGLVNGIQLNTDIKFASDTGYTGASPWLDPPLTLPLDKEYYLEEGEEITISISYELGGGLSNIVYDVIDYPKNNDQTES